MPKHCTPQVLVIDDGPSVRTSPISVGGKEV